MGAPIVVVGVILVSLGIVGLIYLERLPMCPPTIDSAR